MVWLQRSWIWLLNFWLFIRISPTKKRKLCRLFSAFQVRNKVHFREACQKAWSEIGSRTKPFGRWMDGKRWRGTDATKRNKTVLSFQFCVFFLTGTFTGINDMIFLWQTCFFIARSSKREILLTQVHGQMIKWKSDGQHTLTLKHDSLNLSFLYIYI